jgi:lipopolysaccharide transport system ATP-binding protein
MADALVLDPARTRNRFIGVPETAISVQGLGKRYRLQQTLPPTLQHTLAAMVRRVGSAPFWALRDVSFNVGRGEAIGIVGANAAGKTTLLRLICGMGRPTTGQVQVTGRVVALLELGSGFHPHLTGRENLYVSAILSGLSRREAKANFDKIVEFAELRDFIDQPLRTYSSGMLMRLGFAVAIHVDPAVMIIDEVLAVGDAHFQKKCLDRIEEFRRRGKTLLIVSHSMDMIRTFCTRALWLQRGTLVGDGPIGQVLPAYEATVEREVLSGNLDGRSRVANL